MADVSDVVQRSMSINEKLHPRLETAAEQNAILRIGWTNAGDPVPKNGELGLCPGLPEGARIRALGKLGSWVAAFGRGGSFTIQGDAEHFLGAGNNGVSITCEQFAGNYAGYMMFDGVVKILEGAGNDAGSSMQGGILFIRGSAGKRLGGGMSGGTIIVHGDVADEPGIGMTGGKIIINGRCPQPPEGVKLRPLTDKEIKAINKDLEDDMEVPVDAVCLEVDEHSLVASEHIHSASGDLSTIGLVPTENTPLQSYASIDTVALLGDEEGVETIALPLPILPLVQSGDVMKTSDDLSGHLNNMLSSQPAVVCSNPRPIDLAYISSYTLEHIVDLLKDVSGFVVDFDSFPSLSAEEVDGLVVALRGLSKPNVPMVSIQSLSNVQLQHQRSTYHHFSLALSRLDDGGGTPYVASLPIIGRSAKSYLEGTASQAGVLSELALHGHDLAVLIASGMPIACCTCPIEQTEEIAVWLYDINNELSQHLRRIGISTIDALSRAHLRALDYDTAAMSGLRLSGYERPLPHWFSS
jgi:hypothetical protein